MARLPRSVVAGLPHFVIQRGLTWHTVFHDDADRVAYRHALVQASRDAGVAIHGWGLCTDEVRLLVTPSAPQSLSTMMQSVGRRYVCSFNQRHGRNGTPWEGRFRSTVIDALDWFLPCLQYAKSCVVDDPSDSEPVSADGQHASSAGHHLGLRIDEWVSEHALFWAIGNTPFEREVAYRRVLEHPLSPRTTERIRNAALKGWALGSPEFAKSIGALTGRRHEPLARGRPALNAKAVRRDT